MSRYDRYSKMLKLEAKQKEMQPNPKVNQASSSKDPTRGAHTALLLIPVNLVKVKDFQAKYLPIS